MKAKFILNQNQFFYTIFPKKTTEQLNGSKTVEVKQINCDWKNHIFQKHKKNHKNSGVGPSNRAPEYGDSAWQLQ